MILKAIFIYYRKRFIFYFQFIMKTRTLSFIALLTAWTLILTGCNKGTNENSPESPAEQPLNEAAQYCIDNGGTYNIVTSETAVYGECTLADGTVCEEWDYLEWACPISSTIEEKSLTMEEIKDLFKTHFPKSYTYSDFNIASNLIEDEGEHTYTAEEAGILTPKHSEIQGSQVISSGIQDGMVYNDTLSTLENGSLISVVYVINPDTLNFVTAKVTDWEHQVTYKFAY